MSRYAYYNPNPAGRNTGDCAVRAISKALNLSWDEAYIALCSDGFSYKDWGHNNVVWGRLLLKHGFKKRIIPDSCLTEYTAGEFCNDHPHGTYVLALSGHVVCLKDGVIWDSWDSRQEVVLYYFEDKER